MKSSILITEKGGWHGKGQGVRRIPFITNYHRSDDRGSCERLRSFASSRDFETWRQIDVPGHFISEGILGKIDQAVLVVADITRLNFNVVFEAGYALGRGKRIFVILNSALQPPDKDITRLGIFDTLGYQKYTNSTELANLINKAGNSPASFPDTAIDQNAPVYLVDTHYKTDASARTRTKLNSARIVFRLFDPEEIPRLSALEAHRGVASSVGVVVHLLGSHATDFEFNNLRGAFVAGLTLGMRRQLLLLQEEYDPIPVDYRDIVAPYKKARDIDKHIADLAPKIMEGLQQIKPDYAPPDRGFLGNLDLGASAAENEAMKLQYYYVHTDHYQAAISGKIRLVVGRKGSGKTALFLQARDKLSSIGKNVVLDLKPEGHQLKRFKENVLNALGDAVQEHVTAAFWEYTLMLELCHKVLEMDQARHIRDHTLFEPYKNLLAKYSSEQEIGEGDFSERLMRLVDRISQSFAESEKVKTGEQLSPTDVATLLYTHDIPDLRRSLADYLSLKGTAWILFDNLDKGWPTHGVERIDVLLLRSLLEATRSIERYLQKADVDIRTVVFVRNDVYELLVDSTPDRGKDSRVSLDWTDPDQLREVLRLRFIFNKIDPAKTFYDTWRALSVSHVDGEETSDYLIERSLMRPRNFLTLVNHCKSYAVNLQHAKIEVDDIQKAVRQYSADLGSELGLEIRDVFPQHEDILYLFIGSQSQLTLGDIRHLFGQNGISADKHDRLTEILLWFSFLGVYPSGSDTPSFSYTVYYDMKKLKKLARDLSDPSMLMAIHRAFWPFLEIISGPR